jgi:hypothetical protein
MYWVRVRLGFIYLLGLMVCLWLGPAQAQTWTLNPDKPFVSLEQEEDPPADESPYLEVISQGMKSLKSYKFVSEVGGVAFETAAQPGKGMEGKTVSVHYDHANPDGSRLLVKVDGKAYRQAIYDWQLAPIVGFVNTPYTGLVSLFGKGKKPKEYYYIKYHEAMHNTLLGLRLLHADILFISLWYNWNLPALNEKQVLAAGEAKPDFKSSRKAAAKLQKIMMKHKWRSWVLTDIGTQPVFSLAKGKFSISANPYYYFWNLSQADHDTRQKKIREYNASIPQHSVEVRKFNQMIRQLPARLDAYNALVRKHNNSLDPNDKQRIKTELDNRQVQIDSLREEIQKRRQAIRDERARLDELAAEIRRPLFEEVAPLTSAMKAGAALIKKYNPAVYDAYVNTARYAAFFRWVKKNHPENWSRFSARMTQVSPEPGIKTPGMMER